MISASGDAFAELRDDYELIGELGRGGSAIVYRALDRALGREVAIKVVRGHVAGDEDEVARLAREARTAAALAHPNIVTVHSVRRLTDGGIALVMQFVPGRTLKQEIASLGPLSVVRAERVLRDIAEALEYAHDRGVVHRDVKPENIFLDAESGRALLADFGIARSPESDTRLTRTGVSIGTPTYMSPEQIDGEPVDGRSDLYSLGLVGWEMLTGEQPWAGESLYNVIYKQKRESLPPASERRPGVPARLDYVLDGLLQKAPQARWNSASGLLRRLDAEIPSSVLSRWQSSRRRKLRNAPTSASVLRSGIVNAALRTMRFRREDVAAALDARDPPPSTQGAASSRESAGRSSDRTVTDSRDVAPPVLVTAAAMGLDPSDPTTLDASDSRRMPRAELSAAGSAMPTPDESDDWDEHWMREEPTLRGLRIANARRLATVAVLLAAALVGASRAQFLMLERHATRSAFVRADERVVVALPVVHDTARSAPPTNVAADEASEARAPAEDSATPTPAPPAPAPRSSAPTAPTAPASPSPSVQDSSREAIASTPPTVRAERAGDVSLDTARPVAREVAAPIVATSERGLLAAGGRHSCMLSRDGRARCWGANDHGQLGAGDDRPRLTPESVAGGLPFVQLAAGLTHSCGVRATGAAYCWGENDQGQLGDATTTARDVPALVEGNWHFRFVRTGVGFSCGLIREGMPLCWGTNESGELGDGFARRRSLPVPVAAHGPFVALATGWHHACALDPTGTVWCWGENARGQIGDGSSTNRRTPTRVAGGLKAIAISAGSAHSCAVATTGIVHCWGRNEAGQLGTGTLNGHDRPQPIASTQEFVSVTTGAAHTCALTRAGQVWCWGRNVYGQLGDGSFADRLAPVRVHGVPGLIAIQASGAHTCGASVEGETYCWGYNVDGQLGDGTRTNRARPVRVDMP